MAGGWRQGGQGALPAGGMRRGGGRFNQVQRGLWTKRHAAHALLGTKAVASPGAREALGCGSPAHPSLWCARERVRRGAVRILFELRGERWCQGVIAKA